MQRALISFQHDDQDELFNYYDSRTKQRLRKLNMKAIETDLQAETIKNTSTELLNRVTTIVQKSAQQLSNLNAAGALLNLKPIH